MIKEIEQHRSVRSYQKKAVPQQVLDRLLESAVRASNTGNMQMYSIIITRDSVRKKELAGCHFNQPMIENADMLVTFCADVNRFSKWCRMRGAKPQYDNFVWWINGSIDTLLASQNFALAAEHEALGICYLGTTVYTAERIVELLNLPIGVIPVTTLAVGYPDKMPPLADRLPVEAVVHYECYEQYTDEKLDQLWSERENSDETKELLKQNNLNNLAEVFTKNRYKAEDNVTFSKKYFEMLNKQGFFNQ